MEEYALDTAIYFINLPDLYSIAEEENKKPIK